MTRVRSIAAIALAAALVVAVAGCSSDDESSTTTTTTTEQPKDLSVSTPAGEVTLNLDGELPPDWPEDFPVPDGAEAAGSGSLAGDDQGVMVGVFTTSESAKDAFGFYTGDASLEPSNDRSAGIGSAFVGSVDIGGDYDGSVTVAGIESTNYIVVVLNTEGTSAGSTTTTASDSGSTSTSSTAGTSGTTATTTTTTAG